MVSIADCQRLQRAWFAALASATGGRTFSTQDSDWVWLPARRQLLLMFPTDISPAGIRPGLAEGVRLGAHRAGVWLNNAVRPDGLRRMGFGEGVQPCWMAAPIGVAIGSPAQQDQAAYDQAGQDQAGQGKAAPEVMLEPEPPEFTGPDRAELRVTRSQPRQAWHAVARAAGHGGDPGENQAGGRVVGHGYSFYPAGVHGLSHLAGIHNLLVGPSFRRQGYGSGLLSAVCRAAAEAGAAEAALNATPQGQGFFHARGFELIGRGRTYWLSLAG